ncbi:MAG: hypothetical protein GH143_07905 [Calditrichaeota bacterium]|nr:hypothetical protein [Calditrichota bacterium]
MGSSRSYIAVLLVVTMSAAVPLMADPPEPVKDRSYFLSSAAQVSAAMIPAPLPRGEFALITATFYPVAYRPHAGSGLQLMPAVGLQWWVSPNLAIVGGLGSGLTPQNAGLTGQQVVQMLRIGLRYLPESLTLGPFMPEITFVQNGIEGLPDYRLTWNEASWAYDAKFGSVNIACALVFVYQRVFPRSTAKAPDVPGKLEATTRILALSAGCDLFRWLRVSVQAKVSPGFITGGVQLSLAI